MAAITVSIQHVKDQLLINQNMAPNMSGLRYWICHSLSEFSLLTIETVFGFLCIIWFPCISDMKFIQVMIRSCWFAGLSATRTGTLPINVKRLKHCACKCPLPLACQEFCFQNAPVSSQSCCVLALYRLCCYMVTHGVAKATKLT